MHRRDGQIVHGGVPGGLHLRGRARKLYIHPRECIDCGACEPVCPVEAISVDRRVAPEHEAFIADNERFFAEPLPGRDEMLGMPGGAEALGPVGVDTEMVAEHPPQG